MTTRSLRMTLAVLVLAVLAASPPAAAQRPAVDMASLLNIPFYPDAGGFDARNILLLFPPAGADVRLALTDPAGHILHEVPFEVRPADVAPVFAYLNVNSRYGDRQSFAPGEPGDYILSVTVDGEAVGSVPFTLAVERSADPFAPGATWTAEGPWQRLAYLAQPTERPEESIGFDYWVSSREVGNRTASLSLSLRRGGEEVARSRSNVHLSTAGLTFFQDHELAKPGDGVTLWPFTATDLAATDGRYELVVLSSGTPIRTYVVTVEGGRIRPHPQSALDYEPRAGFLSPRLLRTGNSTHTVDAWWVEVAD